MFTKLITIKINEMAREISIYDSPYIIKCIKYRVVNSNSTAIITCKKSCYI